MTIRSDANHKSNSKVYSEALKRKKRGSKTRDDDVCNNNGSMRKERAGKRDGRIN